MLLEFLLLRRPLAHQSKDAAKRQRWKEFVTTQARAAWGAQVPLSISCQLTLVYFCGERPADIDNIIKPIQDALSGVVYIDDAYVTDVDSHRRPLTDTFDLARLPSILLPVIVEGRECVYVRVSDSQAIESYL